MKKNIWIFVAITVFSGVFFVFVKKWLGLPDNTSPQYFADLAWSFWKGHLDLVNASLDGYDLSPYAGRVYAYWPPLPALLIMPFVKFTGPDQFPQRLFSIAIGSINTGIYYLLIERISQFLKRDLELLQIIAFAFFFGWGTSNIVFAIDGNHWVVGQITASTFVLLALFFALERRPDKRFGAVLWSFIFYSLSFMGRSHLALTLPLWLYFALSDEYFHFPNDLRTIKNSPLFFNRRVIPTTAVLLSPIVGMSCLLMAYNYARFKNIFEFGLTLQNRGDIFIDVSRVYGLFHPHFLFFNTYFNLLRLPFFSYFDKQSLSMGFSLFAQCPILIFAISNLSYRKNRLLAAWTWIGIILAGFPMLIFCGTGWVQFGARYLNDIVPFLVLIIFLRIKPFPSISTMLLGVLSIVINLYGVFYMTGPK